MKLRVGAPRGPPRNLAQTLPECAIVRPANWRSGAPLSNERNPERRPDPDALLALAEKGKRGRLLVFIGAAPGAGKTFAMLQRARAFKRALEPLPRRVVNYQGKPIEEFDLDAALRRRPKVIIVDELAHTNAPD